MGFGRPTIYSEELADKICDLIATSEEGTGTLCKMYDWMPDESSIRLWRFKHENFSLKYLKAKQAQGELYAESTLEIAKEKSTFIDDNGNVKVDPGHVAWQKLNVNTRQWHASKLAPKIYGDRIQLEQKTEENEKLREEIAALRVELDAKNIKDY